MPKKPATLRNRIIELRQVPAADLRANPANFRRHPKQQQQVLADLLSEVGIANAVLAYHSPAADGALTLIDGHLRADVAHDAVWPVLVLDVDDAEASKLLATMDPLAALAETDGAALDALLRQVDTGSEAVQQMLSGMATKSGILGEPADPLAGMDPGEGRYKEQYGVIVVCLNELEQQEVYERLTTDGLTCRVVVT